MTMTPTPSAPEYSPISPSTLERPAERKVRPRPTVDPNRRAFGAGSSVPALRKVGTPRMARRIGVLVILGFIATPFFLAFIPWRQSVYGDGRVTGLHPLDRQYTVDAPIYGQVVEYRVNEGDIVKAGDIVAVVQNNDSGYLEALETMRDLLDEQLDLADQSVKNYMENLKQIETARDRYIDEAQAAVEEAGFKVTEAQRKVTETERNLGGYQFEVTQLTQAYAERLVEGSKLVKARQLYQATLEKLGQDQAAVDQAKQKLEQSIQKLNSTTAKQQAEVEKAKVDLQTADAKVRELNSKREKQLSDIRQQMVGEVVTPRAGKVLRLLTNVGAGAQVKNGDPLVILVPETPEMAAEVYLPGRDIPLVQEGDPVRLQFDGWPAVQFVGWPSVAIGTFPGKVHLVDPSDTKNGKFRILVTPDMTGPDLSIVDVQGTFQVGDLVTGQESGAVGTVREVLAKQKGLDQTSHLVLEDEIIGEFKPNEPIKSEQGASATLRTPWPSPRFLRQGAQAKGWVLLREVPLGFEIWRRLNGFNPIVADEEPQGKEGSGAKDDKVKVKRPK